MVKRYAEVQWEGCFEDDKGEFVKFDEYDKLHKGLRAIRDKYSWRDELVDMIDKLIGEQDGE